MHTIITSRSQTWYMGSLNSTYGDKTTTLEFDSIHMYGNIDKLLSNTFDDKIKSFTISPTPKHIKPPIDNICATVTIVISDVFSYDLINKIIEHMIKIYQSTLTKIIIEMANVDVSKFLHIPRNLSLLDCNITFPDRNDLCLKKLTIVGQSSNTRPIVLNLPIEKMLKLEELSITGNYLVNDLDYKFVKLTRLRNLTINNGLSLTKSLKNNHIKLPHLEYCKYLKSVCLSSANIPKSFKSKSAYNHSMDGSLFVKLCKTLRKDPINRMIDIAIALSGHLVPYIILWITDWLPLSDWYSNSTLELYDGRKLPKWKISDLVKIRIIEKVAEKKLNLVK